MGISEGMAMGTTTPILLKVPPPHRVSSTPSITPGAGAGCPPGLGPPPSSPPALPEGAEVPGVVQGGAHSVLEAKLVSSCLSLPSSANPRFSRLLARKGVKV